MRILLIGATGQIGHSLTTRLAASPHQTSVLVRDRSRCRFPGNIRVMEAGKFNSQSFRTALKDADHVIYALGRPEQYLPDPGLFERVNLDLFRVFLDELVRTGPLSLTYISTYEVFQAIDGVIRETHPVCSEQGLSPYFRSMRAAYRLVSQYASRHDLKLVTIHPAAVYGGLNTGDGITNYLDNLLQRRFWRVPFVFDGRFPVVHSDSLAEAAIASLNGDGAYIVSDQMTSLKSIAVTLRQHADAYVPISAPVTLARAGATLLEGVAAVTGLRPLMARVQIDFITRGMEPRPDRIMHELDWTPTTLAAGVVKYLSRRGEVPRPSVER
jgi:nucleoside-diphosphate-sugar epimerase